MEPTRNTTAEGLSHTLLMGNERNWPPGTHASPSGHKPAPTFPAMPTCLTEGSLPAEPPETPTED